jgi:hypothetical protein
MITQEAKDAVLTERLNAIHEGDEVKNVFVPFGTLGAEMIAKLPSVDGSILVMSDAGLLVAMLRRLKSEGRDRSNVQFVCHTEALQDLGQSLGVRTTLVRYNSLQDWIRKADMGLKFDIVVGNPPYSKGMHMKFLDLAFEALSQGGRLVFVHPSTNFISLKALNQSHTKTAIKVKKHIRRLTLINGNPTFNAKFFVPCSITELDKGYDNLGKIAVTTADGVDHLFDSLDDVNQFGNLHELFSLLKKVRGVRTMWDVALDPIKAKYCVSFTSIRGNVSKDQTNMVADDFWTVVGDHVKVETDQMFPDFAFWFKTKIEGENFIKYLKTNFVRRLLSLFKINQHLNTGELAIIPWMDFTGEWSDEKLAKHFKLSVAEVAFINKMPKYHG